MYRMKSQQNENHRNNVSSQRTTLINFVTQRNLFVQGKFYPFKLSIKMRNELSYREETLNFPFSFCKIPILASFYS